MIEIGISDIKNINEVIKTHHGYGFDEYAQSSFKRRINRILELHKHADVASLINKLKNNSSYFDLFLDELTVNTTEMFRDASFWKVMKEKVIPKFATHQTIRIWHAGCSSGEEVFTMAIILKELDLLDKAKIYATDISVPILEKAKKGNYPLRNMDTNSMNYELYGGVKEDFERYYSKNGYNAKLDQSLISNVNWIEQNLITTKEPFMKFDIILCRNVMIYFNAQLQGKVFDLFHASLLEKGVLGIGAKESFIWNNNADDYEIITSEEKIFKKL